MSSLSSFSSAILGLGNPLLDIMTTVTREFLEKYDLESNSAILAGDKQKNLCEDMIKNYEVEYLAGGSVQNTLRVCQWFFSEPKVCSFFGCIGEDDFANQMVNKAKQDNINACYMIDKSVPTGTCACLVTNNGVCRSLCAYLGASRKFNISHIHQNIDLLNKARLLYVSAYHIVVSLESVLFLAQHAHSHSDKIFSFNLSAPYISQLYLDNLIQVLPYVELLFGNETEVQEFAKAQGWNTENMEIIVQKLADFEHKRPRTVVITQGKDDILIAFSSSQKSLQRFSVSLLSPENIKDTNGAGDAFTGGFLAFKLLNRSLKECVEAGIYAAHEVIKQSGCQFPFENKFRV